jgi:hypothetical protein
MSYFSSKTRYRQMKIIKVVFSESTPNTDDPPPLMRLDNSSGYVCTTIVSPIITEHQLSLGPQIIDTAALVAIFFSRGIESGVHFRVWSSLALNG